jgi:hypothetical protein
MKKEHFKKASVLKKRYPGIWESVYDSVIAEIDLSKHKIAHAAAYYATFEHHRKEYESGIKQ